MPRYDVFLSHASADKPAVEHLGRKLRDEGLEPFLDKWRLIPGEPWQEAVEEALRQSRTFVVFVGPIGIRPWHNEEMRTALAIRAADKSRRVIPVLLPGALMSQVEDLPPFLARLTWVDFRSGLDDPEAFRQLICGIKHIEPEGGPDTASFLPHTGLASDVLLDLDAYREHQLSQLAIWERQYTRLDVDPAVALAGQALRPVPNSRLPLTEAFVQQKRLIVLGGAGAGKTTSLLYLMNSVLPEGVLAGSLAGFVPVYIELGRFRAENSSSPLDNFLVLITDALFQGRACPKRPSLDEALRLLESHRFLFLLDGLNEAQAGRASCLMAIDDLAKRYPVHRIVVSSRPHGFSPPQGWHIVLLRELEDAQISEFVVRYTQDEASQAVLQTAAHNPLLRVPLFLHLVVRMSRSPMPDDQRQLRSRSGLMDQYVDSLLQWNLAKGNSSSVDALSLEDRLRGALDRLAEASQTSGQILSLAEARSAVTGDQSDRDEEALKTLAVLCEWGILATDGQNLRFWHQSLQEYFYAGSIVRRWRGSKKQVGRMPWWLRRLAAKPEEEEALGFMVAHLSDEEAENVLHSGLRANPALALSWADDLRLGGRAGAATERFPERVRRFALAACKYSGFGISNQALLTWLGLLSFVETVLISFAVTVLLDFAEIKSTDTIVIPLWAATFACFLFLNIWHYPPVAKLEVMLGVIPGMRDISLRNALTTLAQEISRPRFFRDPALRALAHDISTTGTVDVDDTYLLKWLRNSNVLDATTRLTGLLDTPIVAPLLKEFLKLNNFLSLAALEALATRANRLRNERHEIRNIFWETWGNKKMDLRIRLLARKFLVQAGEHPGGRSLSFFLSSLRLLNNILIGMGIPTSAYLVSAILGIGVVTSFFEAPSPSMFIVLVIWAGLATLIWWDARRIRTRYILVYASVRSYPPWGWGLLSLFFPLILIVYLLNRQCIRRDSVPVDWGAILKALKVEEIHVDNRSITRPPSASSDRW